LVNEFIDKKHTLIRGLAHPVIFTGVNNATGQRQPIRIPRSRVPDEDSVRILFQKFGAVKVSPENYCQVRINIPFMTTGVFTRCHNLASEEE